MERKIRVGAVSYLNTKPLIYGFEKGMMKDEMDLIIDYPSRVAEDLLNNKIDIGLVPVAIIPRLEEYHIISDYCISADGEVASVCLFSEVPMHEIKTVLIDYQSRTSVELLKLLINDFWKLDVTYTDTSDDYISKIKGTTAGLIIGDRALEQRNSFTYIYDLASAWKEFKHLPFVFAAWVSNKEIPAQFITSFNEANKVGLDNIGDVITENSYPFYDLRTYYTKNILYSLDGDKRKGMELFLSKLR